MNKEDFNAKVAYLMEHRIINHFTDNDLYTFTVCNYILRTYPNAEVEYTFFDRNNTVYPKEIVDILNAQLGMMKNIKITDKEIEFMKKKCYYLPEWLYTFLKGYEFDPSEISIRLDNEGHLKIDIQGKWWRTIFWDIPILSMISQIMHVLNGNVELLDPEMEYDRAYDKMSLLLENGLVVSDMGTRRRLSFNHQDNVIKAFKSCAMNLKGCSSGKFVGTSNVYLAMKYDLTPIGTMSHQIISFEENVSGVHECNFEVMRKWSECYQGNLGIYLYDAFGDKVFFDNINSKYAKLFDGLRVDSGDNLEQLRKIMLMYCKFKIDPSEKQIIFSNALNGETAINIHKEVDGCMMDSYGIGTWFTSNFSKTRRVPALPIKAMNIVIKLTKMRYNYNREWLDCVKLSCDKGKTLGNSKKCEYLLDILKVH